MLSKTPRPKSQFLTINPRLKRMPRRINLWLASLLLCAAVHAGKPNVVLILTDDQGWADIGYNNSENVYTPNLDQPAAGGACFENHYVMPQCTPTCVAAFTGHHPGRHGRAPLQATNSQCFPVGTPTLATMLKSAGYKNPPDGQVAHGHQAGGWAEPSWL